MPQSSQAHAAPDGMPPIPIGAFLRPSVIAELVLGLSPLAGVICWGWDAYLVITLHLLALGVSAAWLALRTVTLSDAAMGYFENVPSHRINAGIRSVLSGMRWFYAGVIVFIFALALTMFVGLVTAQMGGPWSKLVTGPVAFWRLVVLDSGLWIALAVACAWESASFLADVVLPRLSFMHGFQTPARQMAPQYAGLSPELRAYLFVRGLVVLRMLVSVFAISVGFLFAGVFGAAALVVVLVALRTATAVLLEAGAIIDAERAVARVETAITASVVMPRRSKFARSRRPRRPQNPRQGSPAG